MPGSRSLVLVALVLLLTAPEPTLACGGHGFRSRGRANTRACFANLRTLEGAVEMYDLDHSTRTRVLGQEQLEALKANGYLQAVPTDPGGGAGSWDHYVMARVDDTHFEIACLVHGRIRGDSQLSARAQLEALGTVEPALLARASTIRVGDLHRPPFLEEVFLVLLELAFWIPAALLVMPFFTMPFPLALLVACGSLFLGARSRPGPGRLLAAGFRRLCGIGKARETVWTAPGVGNELARARCPVCSEGFLAAARLVACCPRCKTPHHEDCQQYLGGCGVFGCAPASAEGLRAAARERQAKSRAVQ